MNPSPYSPYAPPQHHQGPYGAGYVVEPYQPLGWKTTATIVCFAASIVLAFVQTGTSIAFGEVLKQPVPENLGLIAMVGLVGLATSAVGIGGYVFFLMWLYQASKNLRSFGQHSLEYTPGWCVGWWFIPIASLWKPFGAMREIWRASDPETVGPRPTHAWHEAPVTSLLPLWWGIYVLNGFVTMAIALSSMDFSADAGVKATVGPASFISNGLHGIAGIVLIMVMRQLATRQTAAAAKLTSAAYEAPPAGPAQPNPYATC